MAWYEAGLFSGPNERTDPNAFVIERTESKSDDSFRAYVRLTGGTPPDTPWIWHIVAVLTRENGHLVVDDVVFLKDKEINYYSRLSEVLTKGCNGARWVGYHDDNAWWLTPDHK